MLAVLRQIDVRGGDRELTAVRHGVAGVDGEVDDHLLELALIGLDQTQIPFVGHVELDVLADQATQQMGQLGQRVGHAEAPGLKRLLARESEELAHQIGGPVGVLLDLHDVGEGLVAGAVAQQQEVGKADHRRQQVVEIVGDAAGQLADRLHLL